MVGPADLQTLASYLQGSAVLRVINCDDLKPAEMAKIASYAQQPAHVSFA
jgi:hypothetical protein